MRRSGCTLWRKAGESRRVRREREREGGRRERESARTLSASLGSRNTVCFARRQARKSGSERSYVCMCVFLCERDEGEGSATVVREEREKMRREKEAVAYHCVCVCVSFLSGEARETDREGEGKIGEKVQ